MTVGELSKAKMRFAKSSVLKQRGRELLLQSSIPSELLPFLGKDGVILHYACRSSFGEAGSLHKVSPEAAFSS